MRIENNFLVLENGRKFKNIGKKSVEINKDKKELEVYKEYDVNKNDFVEMFADYFCHDKDSNKLYELTFENPMLDEDNNFIAKLSYKAQTVF